MTSLADDVQFVPFVSEYLDALLDIEMKSYPEPWTRGMFLDELKASRSYFFVMLHKGKVIGYGGFWLVLDEAHITSVTIRTEYRGMGLGRKLLHFLLDKARKLGAHTALLEVRRTNTVARTLYASCGFRSIGVRKGYYPKNGEDAIVMLKELD